MVVVGLGNIWLENLLDNRRFNMGLTDLEPSWKSGSCEKVSVV